MKQILGLLLLLTMFLASSCTTLRSTQTERVTIRADTIVRTDTIENRVIIPGEERVVYFDRIDTVFLPRFVREVQTGRFSIDTLFVRSTHATAWFGVRNNRPFMGITQEPIEVILQNYIQRITVLEQQLQEREKVVVKRYLFYENVWFWAFMALLSLVAGCVLWSFKKRV
ncbi:MAG: hypothetical protein LBR65_03885 [Culturomica sp.]|jgi:hypothetical protein|nr:hypothetical protein [Culturomica sp.]